MKTPASRVSGPLAIQSAPQAAAQALREAIISGELKGGDRILEQKWSAHLGIGQPTLREALRELEQQGLLKKLPQRGTYVAQLSPEDYRRILEVRIPLEAIAIGRAAARLTNEAEHELTDLVMVMAGTGKEVDVRSFHDCDVLFHRKIWELADNEYLQETLEKITFRLFVFSVVGRWPDTPNAFSERLAAVQQHMAILEGLRSRNPLKARTAFIQQTIRYWNTQYDLQLNEEEIMGGSLAHL
ncbi:GntR family transcriptional regulator [Silvibacterium acidisoli]|uniref:GntR family transcriptional regulator n=1 Tax=Acidobacteriaceae bacterium ZG23-2 TaxID=2883246 RepID=UPI00406CC3AA